MTMTSAVVIGATGQLGTDLCRRFDEAGYVVSPLGHADLELTDPERIREVLGRLRPALVINAAAMHNVEQCEADPERAFAVNAVGSRNLAMACQELNAVLMQVSTDYVFDGAKGSPYVETDCPRPLNIYANSKLAGEHAVLSGWERSFVVRVSGLYGHAPCRAKGGLNFVQRMLVQAKERAEIRVVDDEILTPTHTDDVARQMVALAKSHAYGIYHATAQGACSWFEFAAHILAAANYRGSLNRAAPGEFTVKVRRPKFSVLGNAALREQGIDLMPHWQDGLDAYLRTVLG